MILDETGEGGHAGSELDRSTEIWLNERPTAYTELDWVTADSLMHPFFELTDPAAGVYVDLGTGTGAVLQAISPRHELAVGVDLSGQMLAQIPRTSGDNIRLIQANASEGVPLVDGSASVVTERMMLHDLRDPRPVIEEAWRLVRPGGQFVASEYVLDHAGEMAAFEQGLFEQGSAEVPPLVLEEQTRTPPPAVAEFMRGLFVLKEEPDRHLWTGEQFQALLSESCPDAASVETFYSFKYMSLANWLEKSGFPIETCKQEGIICCLQAERETKKEMGLTITMHGEAVPEELHAALLNDYASLNSEQREAMGLDAHWFATFANVKLTKAAA